jgi:chromosome segregation ATPase
MNPKKKHIALVFLILTVVFSSCSITHIPRASIAPTKVTPTVQAVDASASNVGRGNERIRAQLASVTTAAQEARQQVDAATKEAEHLAQIGSATKAQLDELWHSLQVTQARNLFLDGELGKQSKMVNDQALLIEQLRKDTASALASASAADAQSAIESTNYSALSKDYDKISKERDGYKSEAARAEVYRHWVIGLALGYIGVAVILPIVFKLLNPVKV